MKITITVLAVAIFALILAMLNTHVVDYDAESREFSYSPRLIEFGFNFSTKTVSAAQSANPLFIGALVLGIAALLTSPFAYLREKDGPVCMLAGGIGIIAILWQLVVLVAIAAIIIVVALMIWLES